MKNTYVKIRNAMRQNEVEVLAHLRQYQVIDTMFFGRSWVHALDRLEAAGRVNYARTGYYKPRKGAQPVTGKARGQKKVKS